MSSRKTLTKPGNMSNEPLDEDQQTQVIEELKAQAEQQTHTQREIFYYIFVVIAIIFLACLSYSLTSPWEMNHQSHFQGHIPHWWFTLFYVCSTYCYAIAASIVKVHNTVNCLHQACFHVDYFLYRTDRRIQL